MLEGRTDEQDYIKHRIESGILPNQPEYIERFYKRMVGRISAHTISVYLNNIIKFLNYLQEQGISIKQEDLGSLDYDTLNNYMTSMDTRMVNNKLKPYTLGYKKEVKSSLCTFFDMLEDLNIVSHNIWKKIELQRGKDAPYRAYMKPEEIKCFIGTVRTGIGSERAVKAQMEWRERDEALITLLIETGMRVGTARLINLDDVNFINNKIIVRGKGNKVDEYIMTPHLAAVLQDWMVKRRGLIGRSERALFLSNQKNRISYGAVYKLVMKYTGKIDKHITPHKIRASFGTNYYNHTKDLIKTKVAMKHSDASSTQIYIVTDEDETLIASNFMSSMLSEDPQGE